MKIARLFVTAVAIAMFLAVPMISLAESAADDPKGEAPAAAEALKTEVPAEAPKATAPAEAPKADAPAAAPAESPAAPAK